MEIELITVQGHKEPWAEEADELYVEKISQNLKFKSTVLKSKKIEREDRLKKVEMESKTILAALRPEDYVILCDERGKTLTSIDLSKHLTKQFDSGKRRVVFVVGGAFGVDDTVRKRSNLQLSLSIMTMNHLVARVVLLEQIYRAIMIWKGRPYHNE